MSRMDNKNSIKYEDEIKFVEDFTKEGIDQRLSSEPEWQLALNFYESKQWSRIQSLKQTLYVPPAPPGRKRVTYNFIKPTVDDFVSLINERRQKFDIIPISSDEKDNINSEFLNRLTPYIDRTVETDTKNQQLDSYVAIFGTAYKMLYWNPRKGRCTNGKYEGDIEVEILSSFNIVKQGTINKLQDSERFTILKIRDLEWIKNTYPDIEPEWITPDNSLSATNTQKGMMTMLRMQDDAKNKMQDTDLESGGIIVKTLIERPSLKYPKGRMLVVAGGVLLNTDSQDLPYEFMKDDGTFNVWEYQYDSKAYAQQYPRGMVWELIEPQRHFNILISLFYENIRSTAKSKFLIPKNAGVKESDIHNENGVIWYMPTMQGHAPKFESADAISGDVTKMIDMAKSFGDVASGISGAVKGESVTNVRTTSQYALMQEQDKRKLGLYVISKEVQEAKVVKAALKLIGEKYTSKRLLEISGDDNIIEVTKFNKDMINFKEVYPVRGSSLPESKVLQNEALVTLGQTLIPAGKMDPALVLKSLGFTDIKKTMDEYAIDEKNAAQENVNIENGIPVEIKQYEDHMSHYKSHVYSMKTKSFDVVKKNLMQDESMTINDYAMQHLQAHMQILLPPQQIGGEGNENATSKGNAQA